MGLKYYRHMYPQHIRNFQFSSLRAEENWKIDFTADESGGKPAIASFPPLGEEENWKVDFTADESGGKPATASFPPLGAEESWQLQLYRR
ncbi:hypothetical protein AAC387_Pa04g0247 [Persea americana]